MKCTPFPVQHVYSENVSLTLTLSAYPVSQIAADSSEEKAEMEQEEPNANPKTKVTFHLILCYYK